MQIKPFKAFRFDSGVVGDVGDCIAPPYDVINDTQQEQLYEKNEHNIVRIIKGKTNPSDNGRENHYTRAAGYLNKWIAQGVLKQDAQDTIYGYVQDFAWAGTNLQRLSFIALSKLEQFGGVVKPHEQILNKPLEDRLNLKRATTADFGLVFMLYEDPDGVADEIIEKALNSQPLINFIDDQEVQHRIFPLAIEEDIKRIVEMMSTRSCVIADGHHRYTTGLTYSGESNDPQAQYQMLAFANTCHKGLIVLPTHRVAGNLEGFSFEKLIDNLGRNFELTEYNFDSEKLKTEAKQQMLARMKEYYTHGKNVFGIYGANGSFYVAVLKDKSSMDLAMPDMSPAWRSLDVSVLHKLILEDLLGIDKEKLAKNENLQYVKDTPNAIEDSIAQVDAGIKQAAFFMNPVKMQQLMDVTEAGERMPQKSTYFYPKVFTGLTVHKL